MSELEIKPRKNVPGRFVIFGLTFLGLYFCWLVWGGGNLFERLYAGNLVMVFTGGTAAYQSWRAFRVEGQGKYNQAWMWITAGLIVSLLGDLFKFLTETNNPGSTLLKDLPYWLYSAGTLLLAIGVSVYPRSLRSSASRAMLLMDTFITTTAVLVLTWLAVFQPLLADQSPAFARGWGSLLFPVMDLALLILVLNLFLLSDPRVVHPAFLWILAGLFAFTLSDLFYIYLMDSQSYQTGSLVDLGWVIGDGCFILAAASQIKSVEKLPERRQNAPIVRLQKLFPVLLVVILGWYSLFFWQFNGGANSLGLWVTVILGIGLIIRQGISTGEQQFIQYASLVNSISEPAFVCDRDGRLRMVNPAFLKITGFDQAQEALGTRLQGLLDEKEPLPPFQQIIRKGWSGERGLQSRTGKWIPVSLSLQPIQPGGDERLSLAGTAHDLRELKKQQKDLRSAYEQIARAHDELEKMNLQLEEKVAEETANLNIALNRLEKQNRELQKLDELKSDFVSLVSHELRAPLTNINGGIELVLSQGRPLPVRTRQSLELVQGEISRLTRFVETILDISALDAGRLPLTIAPLTLESVVSTLKRQMIHLQDNKRIEWQISGKMPEIMADENALNSILFHLLDNAFKYAPEGKITVTSGSKGERAWISVVDSGQGIPEGGMPYLFDRFYRYNSGDDRDVYGHGMGLYIVKRLLEAMEGSIEVHNLPRSGAQFTCWLPQAESERSANAG